jgi:hypothetical protein
MCCFSKPMTSVSATSIFAREAPGGGQYLAYSMTVAATEDLAMILPLPVPLGAREGAVSGRHLAPAVDRGERPWS